MVHHFIDIDRSACLYLSLGFLPPTLSQSMTICLQEVYMLLTKEQQSCSYLSTWLPGIPGIVIPGSVLVTFCTTFFWNLCWTWLKSPRSRFLGVNLHSFRVQTRQIGVGQYSLQSQDRAYDAIEKLSDELCCFLAIGPCRSTYDLEVPFEVKRPSTKHWINWWAASMIVRVSKSPLVHKHGWHISYGIPQLDWFASKLFVSPWQLYLRYIKEVSKLYTIYL